MRALLLVAPIVLSAAPISSQTVEDMIIPDYIVFEDGTKVDVIFREIKNLERSPKKWEKGLIYSRLDRMEVNDTVFLKDLKEYQQFELWKANWPTNENGQVQFEEVIQVQGASADQLFLLARTWFVDYFKSAQDVIQFEDKSNGVIKGKGLSEIVYQSGKLFGTPLINTAYLNYTITIQVRDGRYKYTIDNLFWRYPATQYTSASEAPITAGNDVERFSDKNGKPFEGLVNSKELAIRRLHETVKAIKRAMALDNLESEDDW